MNRRWIPTRGERNTQKILGSVSLQGAQFAYRHQTECFNHQTYGAFVADVILPTYYRRGHRVYLIQDNASYHTHPEVWAGFRAERRRLEVFPLPKYSPELNAQERLWHYTRREATHSHAGGYSVIVSNVSGATTSAVATLTVNCLLNATATAGGSVARNPALPVYPGNSQVTLTADPDAGFGLIGQVPSDVGQGKCQKRGAI